MIGSLWRVDLVGVNGFTTWYFGNLEFVAVDFAEEAMVSCL